MFKTTLCTSTAVFAVAFGFEHYGRKKEERLRKEQETDNNEKKKNGQPEDASIIVVGRPSVYMTKLTNKSRSMFSTIGTKLAVLSSFYTCIDAPEILQTVSDLVSPTLKFLFSPLYTISGYFSAAKLYDHPKLVALGSLTILASGLLVHYKGYDKQAFETILKYFRELIVYSKSKF